MRKVTVLAALLLLAPAVSQAKSLEDLLAEKGVITKGEAASASSGGPAKVYWNEGTRLDFPDNGFTVKINTLLQTRYTFTDQDEESGSKNTSSFDINKARLYVSGTAMHNEFDYMVNADFVGDEDDDGEKSPALLDAYLTWHGCDWLDIKMGQYKTQLGRQFLTEDHKLQFADRSMTSDYFDNGRQAGLTGTWKDADGKYMLSAAIFNGESDGEGLNKSGVDTQHMAVVNARAHLMGKMNAYEEGDIGWTEDSAVSVGASYAFSKDDTTVGVLSDEVDTNTVSVDANWKLKGWSVHAEYFTQNEEGDIGDEIETNAFYAQVGYFVKPKKLEIAARYAYLDCDDGAAGGICSGNDNVNEVAATVNYHWWKHNLKAQFGYYLTNEDESGADGEDINTNKWMFQLSSYF